MRHREWGGGNWAKNDGRRISREPNRKQKGRKGGRKSFKGGEDGTTEPGKVGTAATAGTGGVIGTESRGRRKRPLIHT